ncbi:MAG: 3-phosphoshikimate 1-carboxyvinyltransferase, partial [Rhodospirillales bacterium]
MSSAPQPQISRKAAALRGTVRVPGDKSISHRALILAACAVGQSRVRGLLES